MLVLSRKRNETIVIGDDIVITVVEILPEGKVKVGIQAPRAVRVDRGEVRDRIEREGFRRPEAGD
jgi:carbon storage regulator